jgi:hypothetical protein
MKEKKKLHHYLEGKTYHLEAVSRQTNLAVVNQARSPICGRTCIATFHGLDSHAWAVDTWIGMLDSLPRPRYRD